MEIRYATIEDLNKIASLEAKYFIGPWTEEQFKYELIENQFSKTLILIENDSLIGYCNYWVIFDQGEINKICIEESYRKQGLATKLLDKAFDDFQKNECLSVSLEVRVSNVPAQKLYEKYGFMKVVVKEKYYSDGEDAYYMIKGAY